MGGKNYPKDGKKKSSKGSSSNESVGAQQTAQPTRNIRERLQEMTTNEPGTSGTQAQGTSPAQSQQQQQQPRAWGPGQQQQQPRARGPGQQQQQQGEWRQRPQQRPTAQEPKSSPQPQQQPHQQQAMRGEPSSGGSQQQGSKARSDSVQSERSVQSVRSQGDKGPQKSATEKLIASMKNVPDLKVTYKGQGKRGQRLGELETNYLKLIMNKMVANAYHYDVTMEPDRPKKLLTQVFMQFVAQNFPGESIAFDGAKNAYSARPLKYDSGSLERNIKIIHPETGRERTYVVSIQAANDTCIPIRNLLTNYQQLPQSHDQTNGTKRALQAMEVILKAAFHQQHLRHGIQGGRSFFLQPTGRRFYLGDFYELWLGLFQSIVLGETPMLNVDVNHKAFPKHYSSMIDLLKDMENDLRMNINPNQSLPDQVLSALERHLGGLEIKYNVPNAQAMVYKFMCLEKSPANVTFTLQDGRQTTVERYFRESGRKINYPYLPCIKLGNTIKNITVPMEFCSISDKQVINKKCTENQTRNIIKEAATSTDIRKQKIMDLVNRIRHNDSATVRGFGLQVDTNFVKVPARKLDAPKLEYGNRRLIEPRSGVWRSDNCQFLDPQAGIEWSILNVNFRTKQNELNDLASMLYKVSGPTGLQLAPRPADVRSFSDRELQKVQSELQQIAKAGIIRIVFVVIPDAGQTYAKVKQMAEIQCGVLTQCIKGGTVFRKRNDASTISNILLKVNAKLNGTNHKLQSSPILESGNVMIVGADVTHPSPEQTKIPSVVGVSASHDRNAFCYNMSWRLQGQRQEIIQDFKQIIKEHLTFFQKKNKKLPEKILYYRDGVSEGQFDQVMAIERNAMVQACKEISPGYEKKVKMTVVVVQKRHHTRFFPGDTGIGREDRKNNNVPAGTIVDGVITRPLENQFYLVSHQSIQGVAKPTKYCILLDEGEHNIDDLQALTYNLCHLFARCNRSVSYPAPTYYAHLVAARGKVYIETDRLDMNRLNEECNKRIGAAAWNVSNAQNCQLSTPFRIMQFIFEIRSAVSCVAMFLVILANCQM